jgi:hypothetical protein
MKVQLVLAAIVAYVIGQDSVCRKYDCSTTLSTNSSQIGTLCGSYETNITTFLVQPCGSADLICPFTLGNETDATCANSTEGINPFTENFLPGDKCSNDGQCFGAIKCQSNVCVGAAVNAACNDIIDCDNGLFCNNTSICAPVKQSGETCSVSINEVCAFGTDCYYGVCRKFGTIHNEKALLVGANEYLCHSFYAAQGTNGSYFCVNPPALISDDFERSDPNNIMCNYTTYQAGTGERVDGVLETANCGFNMENSHWCPVYKGEFSFADQSSEYREMWNNTFACHVESNGLNCVDIGDRGYRTLIAEWIVDEFETGDPENYAFVADNAECIKDTINAAYWYVKNIHSAPIFTGVVGMIVSAFYFIY